MTAARHGRHQLYRIDADAFSSALTPWLIRYEACWSTSLAKLKQLAESADEAGR